MNDWYWWVIALVGVITVAIAAYKILGIDKIKNWLLWACTEAEKQFGSGTGKLKLAYVYDMFINKFPKLQVIIPFSLFSKLVDQALVLMRMMLENKKIADIVVENTEISKEKGDVNA